MIFLLISLNLDSFYQDFKNLIDWFNRIGSPVGFEMLYIDKVPEISGAGGIYFFSPENSALFNPSFPLLKNDYKIISISHRTHYAGSYIDKISYLSIKEKFYLGFIFEGFFSNQMELHDTIPETSEEYYNGYDLSFNISSGYKLKNLQIGLTLKYLYEKIFVEDISTFGFDLGITRCFDNLKFGFALLNMGPKYYGKLKYRLPITWRIGSAYEKNLNELNIGFGLDIVKPLHNVTEFHTGINFKYNFVKVFFGKKFRNTLEDFSSGFGLMFGKFGFSYSFLILKNTDFSSNIKTHWRF